MRGGGPADDAVRGGKERGAASDDGGSSHAGAAGAEAHDGGECAAAALGELGIVAAQGIRGLRELMARLEMANAEIPERMRGTLLVLARHWQVLDADERARSDRLRKPPAPIARRAG